MKIPIGFTVRWLLLMTLGIALNLAGSHAIRMWGGQLYLDSVGTVVATLVGGVVPGIAVGYFSNALNMFHDPDTLYYGFICTLIAIATALMARAGWFRRLKLVVFTIPVLALVGGGCGSLMTWLLNGSRVPGATGTLIGHYLVTRCGMSGFAAQMINDLVVDLADKTLTVGAALVLMFCLPRVFLAGFDSARYYWLSDASMHREKKKNYRVISLHAKLAVIIGGATLLVGMFAVFTGYFIFRNVNYGNHAKNAAGLARIAASSLEAADLVHYGDTGETDAGYRATAEKLENMRKAFPQIAYIYVYQVATDADRVVFDCKIPDVPADSLGDLIPIDPDMAQYRDQLERGRTPPPVLSSGPYGTLLTAYSPVCDADGQCVAYVGVDLEMKQVVAGWRIYLVKMSSVLCGMLIVGWALAITFINWTTVRPLNAMTAAADDFSEKDDDRLDKALLALQRLHVKTGDEIETLYDTLVRTTSHVVRGNREKRIILDTLPHPLGLFDRNGVFISGNSALMQLTHAQAGIMQDGCRGCRACGGEDQCMLLATVKDGAAHVSTVLIGEREYQVQANPVLNGENEMTGIVISFVDLTESLRSKARLQEALRVERDTNQTKQHFLANFGHEIKTPLNAIVGFGDVLQLEKNDQAKVAEYVGLIRESAVHLQSLFDTISDLMMADSDASCDYCRPTDVRKKLGDLEISFRDFLSEQNNHLSFDIAPDVPELLQLDAPCVRRVLTHLLHNACKYTRNGAIDISVVWNAGELRIACRDTGVGIPADKLKRIFEPFFQVDAVRDKHQLRGEGLGLAAARQQARRMSGRIVAESREGVGSVFTLILQNVQVVQINAVPAAPAEQPAEGKLVALVLDDIELNVKVLASLCGKADLEVIGTTRVDEAFEILQKENVSLVFADVWMPVMDGAAFARKVHTLPGMEKLPIYAVTADMAVQHNFDVSVFRGVLQKPMTLAKLNAVLESFRRMGSLDDSREEHI